MKKTFLRFIFLEHTKTKEQRLVLYMKAIRNVYKKMRIPFKEGFSRSTVSRIMIELASVQQVLVFFVANDLSHACLVDSSFET